jgi:hypothetical protein
MKQKKYGYRWGLVLLAIVVGLLSGCKKKDSGVDSGPTEYEFGEETVLALGATVEEFPEEGSCEESEVSYIYRGLTDSNGACTSYVQALAADEEAPFTFVDEELYMTDTPALTEDEGTIYMARATEVEGELCVLQLDWAEDSCTVTLELQEGEIQQRPVEETTSSSSMTLDSAISYFKGLSPASLGLEGTSMDEYQVYALDGVIFVDGTPCLHLKAYQIDNPQQANELAGDFLMTGDGRHMYSLDEVNGTVTVVF